MNINELRLKLGYTQRTLAKEVGVSLVTIQNWEADIGKPNEKNMAKLKQVLNYKE